MQCRLFAELCVEKQPETPVPAAHGGGDNELQCRILPRIRILQKLPCQEPVAALSSNIFEYLLISNILQYPLISSNTVEYH